MKVDKNGADGRVRLSYGKSSVPRGSKNREQALGFYSLTRPVEPVTIKVKNTTWSRWQGSNL